MHENMKTSMWHTGRSERTWRLPACLFIAVHSATQCWYACCWLEPKSLTDSKSCLFYSTDL